MNAAIMSSAKDYVKSVSRCYYFVSGKRVYGGLSRSHNRTKWTIQNMGVSVCLIVHRLWNGELTRTLSKRLGSKSRHRSDFK